MSNSKWATTKELKERLVKITKEDQIVKSGLPIMYDEDSIYIDNSENHVLVIGSNGSGKTQSVLLPEARLAIRANESIVINDLKGEIYKTLEKDLIYNEYHIIKLNLSDINESNKYNIFDLAYKLYQNGEKDKSIEVLENTVNYVMNGKQNIEDFWENTASKYLMGLLLYLFETNEKVPTLKEVFKLGMEFDKEIINNFDKASAIYVNLAPTVLAPAETKGGIISVFSQKLGAIISREQINRILEKSDFDIFDVINSKFAFFIIGTEINNSIISLLTSIIVSHMYFAKLYCGKDANRLNVLIDEFDGILPITNFDKIMNNSRSIGIKYTVFIKSLLELKNNYEIEKAEIVKNNFGILVYLLSNDIDTIEDIVKMCGTLESEDGVEKNITSTSELQLLNMFEAVVLIPRMHPIKTKLLPDYNYLWNK